jgi:hypothetical protein
MPGKDIDFEIQTGIGTPLFKKGTNNLRLIANWDEEYISEVLGNGSNL